MMLLVANPSPANVGLKRLLANAGLAPQFVSDRKSADRKTTSRSLKLIVLDLLWSRDDPFAAVQRWRGGGLRVPILALAGRRGAWERVRALDLGADDVLPRPFDPSELLARARALVRRGHPDTNAKVLRVHDLEIDFQAHLVRRAGRLIRLTTREFALLEVLARQPGKVVSREAITRHLYGTASPSNAVNVFIGLLRKKVDDGFHLPLILTRWGEGYLLRGE
jgi:DNA-binding response OmpR family regulator